MAMHGRQELVRKNLLMQPKECNLIVVASDDNDVKFLERLALDNLHIVIHPNEPLGAKWQAGVDAAKKFDCEPLIILGSDDFLSDSFTDGACELMRAGVDFAYFTKWKIFDEVTQKTYALQYKIHFPLGSGRCFSRRFLERHDWRLFDTSINVKLDDYAFDNLKVDDAVIVNPNGMHLMSVKGKHTTMNPLDKILQSPNIEWEEVCAG
jgi:hypothetical protein